MSGYASINKIKNVNLKYLSLFATEIITRFKIIVLED